MTHGTLRVACRRLNTIIASRAFREWRVERGLAEYGLVVAGGDGDDRAVADCSMFTCGWWRPITPLSGPRGDACSAIVEDEDGQPEMWVMGGSDGRGNILTTVEAYNPRTNTWRSCLPLSQRRMGAVTGVVGGRLVVAGGDAGIGPLTSVEAYTPTGWTPLPPLPHAAAGATACMLNGRLYVMGGRGCNKLQVLEMSEEIEFSWTVKADLPAARRLAASVVHEGKLWLMGGLIDQEATELTTEDVAIYDPENDTWAAGPPLPRAVIRGHATVLDGEIHFVSTSDDKAANRVKSFEALGAGNKPESKSTPIQVASSAPMTSFALFRCTPLFSIALSIRPASATASPSEPRLNSIMSSVANAKQWSILSGLFTSAAST